jgi:hypothetical protein
MTRAEQRHMDRVAALPCAVCGDVPVHVHHIREGHGMGQRASNFLTIPLCPSCHQGPHGVHGDKAMLRIKKLSELSMLADTIERLV